MTLPCPGYPTAGGQMRSGGRVAMLPSAVQGFWRGQSGKVVAHVQGLG